ncbi:hypothetical protein P154DRAFT_518347 [Amniculicola lignicola CBS 123094]|uniref:Uncharacterized protein n=1 Tax=Amniculicola lignicola CBS 123094 TaxID=1392246 RepID=A0A6A5WUV0_9PLEO|nr:hypothetical protein P154DRAFT_518347 [Amniculicola lignicola CBS 123094]
MKPFSSLLSWEWQGGWMVQRFSTSGGTSGNKSWEKGYVKWCLFTFHGRRSKGLIASSCPIGGEKVPYDYFGFGVGDDVVRIVQKI